MALYWLTSLAAVAGVWLDIRKHVSCFWIWAATSAVWAYADFTHGLQPQSALQAVYFSASIYGIQKWRGTDKGE